jgi:uncharacterized membrane protein YbhN (UPF0104 family)
MSSFLAIAFVAFGIYSVDIPNLWKLLNSANITYFVLALPFMWLAIILRGFRIGSVVIQDNKVLIKIASIHNTWNSLLPFRLGEISLVLMLKQYFNLSYIDSLAALSAIRLGDVALMLICGGTMTAIVFSSESISNILSEHIASIFLFIFVALVAFFFLMRNKNNKFHQYKKFIKNISRRKMLSILGFSTAIWLSLFILSYFSMMSINENSTLVVAFVGFTGAATSVLFPISGFANIGSYHATWVGALMLYGLPIEEAVATGIISHAIMLTGTLSMFIFGMLIPAPRQNS